MKDHGSLFNENIRLNYSETEVVNGVDDIKNEIARECLKLLEINNSIYISTISDLPAQSGLGSSSSFAVGLLRTLNIYKGKKITTHELAEQAARIEIEKIGNPIGKQDQYAAAYGGLNIINFINSKEVVVNPIKNEKVLKEIFENSLFFWTDVTRNSANILQEQKNNIDQNFKNLIVIKKLAKDLIKLMDNGFSISKFGEILDKSWRIKRKLSKKISNNKFDELYSLAKKNGALGGKILGAGGGGFFLIIAKKVDQKRIIDSFTSCKRVHFSYEEKGSQVIYNNVSQ